MRDSRSFAITLGHSRLQHDPKTRKILSAWLGTVRFHMGYIGESAYLKITRSFFFGLYQRTWEAFGPADSIHRLPNGATVWIGKQGPNPRNEVPVTGLIFQDGPAMWSDIVAVSEPAC